MGFIEAQSVSKKFGHNLVVRDLSLSIEKGEFVSLLGGSGCGKTTTLRMIAGFETPSSGRIFLDGADIDDVPPSKRRLGMVFQNYALFPNMSVRKNIGFGLKVLGMPKAEADDRVDSMLELIRMEEYGSRYPHQLSGGQQQRVALARAIAIRPAALLLDEPLSALDAKIRLRLRDDIKAIQRKLGITTLYVTHDQEEALSISDRVAVMRDGRIEQIGTPFEIYNHPATRFVAAFIGTLNFLDADVVDPEMGSVSIGQEVFRISESIPKGSAKSVRLALRPESLTLLRGGREPDGDANVITGTVEAVKFLGSTVRLVIGTGKGILFLDQFNDPRASLPEAREKVAVSFGRDACRLLPDDSGAERD